MPVPNYAEYQQAEAYKQARRDKAARDTSSGVGNFIFGGGATAGMPGGPQTADYQRSYLGNMLGKETPQLDQTQSNQSRGQQQNLAGLLFGQASGNIAGAGEMAVNRQVGQATAAQAAQAQMARGANSALAARTAARMTADIGINGAGQAAIAQAQDQANAQGQLGGLLGGMRSQDINTAATNLAADQNQQQIQISALAQMLGVDEAQLKQELAKRQLAAGDKGMLGTLMQIGGQAAISAAGAPGK